MKGYSLIPEELWPKYTLQLENVHKLYDNFLAYIETAKDDKSSTPSDRVHYSVPVFHYFTVLRKAGLYERLFEVYNLLEAEGSELLTPQVYSSMFAHLSHRKALPSGMEGDVRHKSASDARLIWRQMLRTFAKTGYEADAILITHLIFCLSRGRPADQLFAFDIVRDYLGLVPPGEPAVQSKIPMHPYAFVSVLELCMASKKYALCIHYTLQMMEREPEMVDARTCEVALRALASRSSMGTMAEASQALEIVEFLLREAALSKHRSAQLWPTPSIYRAALAVCWRGGDWVTATRLFELITRIDADSFLDGQTPAKPPSARPGAAMDVSNMSLLVRTALASGVPAHMRQCLRMVDHIQLLDELQPDAIASSNTKGLKLSLAEYNYYRGQYAFRLVSLINAVFKHNALVTEGKVEAGEDQYVIPEGEQRRWLSIRTEVTGYMEARPGWKLPTSVPFIERSQLGSAGQIAKAEESVDNEMTNRHIKSAPAAS
ncbi:hypothetical protein PsYK624_004630 [Phanerochaete sordida]|uniref:Uncharacterized protein n=1 Tax=Phanerochaete sordida TaxID=48140 RepID=A0A9P3L870_9APHY|nr:hypothetical protein PsYK624_004630 [Phanerochaete sordida]